MYVLTALSHRFIYKCKYIDTYKYYLRILLLMTKINKSSAKRLIELFDNVYANDREEWYHVRSVDGKILMEVNLYYSYVRVYVDYMSECYVMLDRVEKFDLYDAGDKDYLRVVIQHSPRIPFIVEVE